MSETKFKVGDKVTLSEMGFTKQYEWDEQSRFKEGEVQTIERINTRSIHPYTISNKNGAFKDNELKLVKGNVKPDNHIRYMAFGVGCNNRGDLLRTEKELKADLVKVTNDSDWYGQIIGYKLIPLYEAQKSVKLKSLTKKKKK